MYAFTYERPRTLAEAEAALGRGADARVLAGGMSLLPTMKLRLSAPDVLVDLRQVPGLSGIRVDGSAVTIGAMTTHHEVLASSEIAEALPALASLAGGIGDVQVRYRGTIGGSVANCDPAADYPAAVLGLGATVVTNRREIAADDFFVGMFETALAPGEIIVAIRFPVPERAVYLKFANLASRFAIVGLFAAKFGRDVRIAVTGAAASVFRLHAFEKALSARLDRSVLDGLALDDVELLSDLHASAAYRGNLIRVLAARAADALTG
jgi:carbon-monoxide dehydrogenase medium subunit